MNFALDQEHLMIKEMVRDFAEKEVRPRVNEFEEKEIFPTDLVKRLGELGLMGIIVPQQYGGAGMDTLAYAIAEEELARVWASLGLIMSANNSLSEAPILDWGNEEQKKKYLTPLASGQHLGCYALTEPDAGSDAANQKTNAVLQGSHYAISGVKRLITNASQAHTCVLIARTGPDRYGDLSAFIVETSTPGFAISRIEKKFGLWCAPACEIVLDDCRVPKDNLLSREGDGWDVAMKTLNGGRINIAAQSLGIAQCAFEEAVRHSLNRQQFGRRIGDFQMIQEKLAVMSTEIEAARGLTWKAAWLKDQGMPEKELAPHAARAKLFASEVAWRAADQAVRIFGGDGFIRESVVARCLRDAVAPHIYEGTSEIQEIIIARNILSGD